MNWVDELEVELQRGKQAEAAGNAGRVRTCARRAVGVVVTEFQSETTNKYGNDAVRQLEGIASDDLLPGEVREAAERLHARILKNFTSRSEHPLDDALVIIDYFRKKLLL